MPTSHRSEPPSRAPLRAGLARVPHREPVPPPPLVNRAAVVTTAPGSTTDPHPAIPFRPRGVPRPSRPRARRFATQSLVLVLLAPLVTACGFGLGPRRAGGPAEAEQQDPSLSGDGRLLASVVRRGDRDTLILQEQPSGRDVPLPQLRNRQPHRSPSLSWSGRYLGLIVQQGPMPSAVILDRATGRLQPLPLPGDAVPERLSLAPDGRRVALQILRAGRQVVHVLDLTPVLEADLPGGLAIRGDRLP